MGMKCKDLIINRIYFERNLKNIDTDEMTVSLNRSVWTNVDTAIRDARLNVKCSIKTSETGKEAPFKLEIEIVVIMGWTEELSKDLIEQSVVKEGMPYAISFIRSKVYELTNESGLNPFILEEYDWR